MSSKKTINQIRGRVASNLRRLRLEKDYSQQYVSEYMGKTDYTAYQRLESGKTEVKLEDAAILASLYHVPMETIWNGPPKTVENEISNQQESLKTELLPKPKSIFIQIEIDGTKEKLDDQITLLRDINSVFKVKH